MLMPVLTVHSDDTSSDERVDAEVVGDVGDLSRYSNFLVLVTNLNKSSA